MRLQKRNRNLSRYLADAMFFWIAVLITVEAVLAAVLHAFGNVFAEWTGIAGLGVCSAVSWTVYVLHKRYILSEVYTLHTSAFLGVSLLVFVCLYNTHQYPQVWTVFLLYPVYLCFWGDRVLLLCWGGVSYMLFLLSMLLGMDNLSGMSLLHLLSIMGGSMVCAWMGCIAMQKAGAEARQVTKEENREYAIHMLNTLVPIVERKTQISSREIEQMSRLIKRMLREFPEENVLDWEVKLLALLHYVSRIKWPDYVFESEEKLTTFEYQMIQEHCQFGRELFGDEPALARVVRAMQEHHERCDGSGYPKKLKGEDICLLAQILGIVECFLAMTTTRVYRQTFTMEEAYLEISQMAGSVYDERVVRAFEKSVQILSPTKVSHVPPRVG